MVPREHENYQKFKDTCLGVDQLNKVFATIQIQSKEENIQFNNENYVLTWHFLCWVVYSLALDFD